MKTPSAVHAPLYAAPSARLADKPEEKPNRRAPRALRVVAVAVNALHASLMAVIAGVLMVSYHGRENDAYFFAMLGIAPLISVLGLWPGRHYAWIGVFTAVINVVQLAFIAWYGYNVFNWRVYTATYPWIVAINFGVYVLPALSALVAQCLTFQNRG